MLNLTMDNIWIDVSINFLVGIVSSTFFILVVLRLLQPRIKISDKICFKKDENGNVFYFFKIVNMSIFNAYSCYFELHRREPYVVDKKKVNHRITKIKLSKPSIYSIPRLKKEIGYGDHAVLVRTFEDLSSYINT
jgi:hypothetical protein